MDVNEYEKLSNITLIKLMEPRLYCCSIFHNICMQHFSMINKHIRQLTESCILSMKLHS